MISILLKIHIQFLKFRLPHTAFLIAYFSIFSLFLSGCGKENPVPAYVYIPSFSLITKSGEGTNSHKITDAWVYVDGQINGVFQMPITLPIVELGQHEITVFAGIRNNGTRSNPIINPFFTAYKITRNLSAGKVDTLQPTSSYIANTQFKIMENFELGNIFTVNRDNDATLRFTNVDNGFEGKSGQIVLTKSNPIMEKASTTKAQLSDSAENIYLEMNYKTQAELTVGLVGSDNLGEISTFKITLFPSKEWNKTYINLTNEAKDLKKKDFQIVFRSLLPDTLSSATILIDNVKLIQK